MSVVSKQSGRCLEWWALCDAHRIVEVYSIHSWARVVLVGVIRLVSSPCTFSGWVAGCRILCSVGSLSRVFRTCLA